MPEDAVIEVIRSEPGLSRLSTIIEEMGSVAIAYSGGVDSAFLLKVATAVPVSYTHLTLPTKA